MCKIDWNIVIQSIMAFGTLAAVCVAIWGNWIKYRIVPPRLILEPFNIGGTLTQFNNGVRVIYYHLRVRNLRSWSIAKNCRVILRSIHKLEPNGVFQNIPLPVQPSFVWAPAGSTPPIIDLSHEQAFDFGRIAENGNGFEPVLYFYPNNFGGFVTFNTTIRYSLEIVADGFRTARLQVFQVSWNGIWNADPEIMNRNLTIQEI